MTALRQVRIEATRISENAAILLRRSAQAYNGVSTSAILAVDVSGNGYGHGAVTAAQASIAGGASLLVARDLPTVAALKLAGFDSILPAELPSAATLVTGELYGLTLDSELRPVMRVSATVAGLKTIDAGEGVSYGYTYRAAQRTNLALLGIGYADGLDRRASNRASISVGGIPRLIAGRVAMNAVMVDLGNDAAAIGDEAVLFGDPLNGEPHITSWAATLGIRTSEVATEFGSRIVNPRGSAL